VLFSNKQIADYINTHFEPVWQSVRPVPIVHIDFGNGKVLTRTLHGNIATYLCNSSGQVLDILPGIYQPGAYADRLDQLYLLSKYVDQAKNEDQLKTRLVSYHTMVAKQLVQKMAPPRFADLADFSKRIIERGTKVIMMPGLPAVTGNAGDGDKPVPNDINGTSDKTVPHDINGTTDVASWQALLADTDLNENERREKIHTMLATRKLTAPKDVTKWLYREVLHADLDDPYLGLGPTLFANYPFMD
jgi:hypothetical protein